MSNRLYKLAICAVLCVMASPITYADSFWGCPYIGINAEWRHPKWKKNFGQNAFNKNLPQGNIYAGLKFCDHLGLEAGYQITSRVSRTVAFGSSGFILGFPIFPPEVFTTKVQIKGWHASVVGFVPVWEDCFSIIGSIGLASLKVYHQIFQIADPAGPFSEDLVTASLRSFKKTRTVLKLGVGLQQMVSQCVGIRFIYNWEQTSRFKNITPIRTTASPSLIRLKNSHGLGLGIVINF